MGNGWQEECSWASSGLNALLMIHVILLGCVIVPLNSLLVCILGDRILGFAFNSEDTQVH